MKISAVAAAAATFVTVVTGANGGALGTIPFKRDGQLMMVEARINDAALAWFVIDTGASHSVLDPSFASELRLETTAAPPTTGTGSGTVAKSHTTPLIIDLQGVKLPVPQPWVIDLSKTPIPKSVRGLIGAELFKTYVVRMDPVHANLTIFEPASYKHE